MSFIRSNELEKKYNWVDAKPIADQFFNDMEFELQWAEDAWNLLMFGTEVRERNILQRELDLFEKGDILIWILTLYQFHFDYKCIIGYETAYSDHDVGMSGFATYRSLDLFSNICEIDDGYKSITKYLWNEVLEELNDLLVCGEAPKQSFYNPEDESFSFEGDEYEILYNTEREVEGDSVAKKVLLKEIQLRREYFTNSILKIYDYDYTKVYEFLTTRHWIEKYSDYEAKKETIERAYAYKIRVFDKEGNEGLHKFVNYKDDNYESVEEIEDEMNEELEELDYDSLGAVNYADAYEMEILDWIENGMDEL